VGFSAYFGGSGALLKKTHAGKEYDCTHDSQEKAPDVESGDLPHASWVPMKPPIIAPTTPMTIVIIHPEGSFPGVSHFAITPAISPNTIQDRIPIFNIPSRLAC
jgi:hypothetical protein